jgi:hypothetical protein
VIGISGAENEVNAEKINVRNVNQIVSPPAQHLSQIWVLRIEMATLLVAVNYLNN